MNPFTESKIIGDNIAPEVYQRQEAARGEKDFVVSRGMLMEFARCPRRWLAGYESSDSDSSRWGNLLDCLALSPEGFSSRYSVAPETYFETAYQCPNCESVTDSKKCRNCKTERVEIKVKKEWNWNAGACDNWKKEQGSKTVIKSTEYAEGEQALKILRSDPLIESLLANSKTQVMISAQYFDKATGLKIQCKALLDFVPDASHPVFGKSLGDFKTSASAAPDEWQRSVYKFNYDAQAAMYLDMYLAATDEDRQDWFHLVQENFAPFEVLKPLPLLTSEFMDIGRSKYIFALRHYAQCLSTNIWPSYSIGDRQRFGEFFFLAPDNWTAAKTMREAMQTDTQPAVQPEPCFDNAN